MNAIALLLALLVVAYIGSSLSVARGVRGYSLPSGVEYVVLGAVLGPSVLGVVDRSTLSSMSPVFVFALGWIALEHGLECGFIGAQRVPWSRFLAGSLLAGLLGATIAGAVYAVLQRTALVPDDALWSTSIGVAMVSCESTRYGLRWVIEHHGVEGPLSRLIADISAADSAVPLLALGWWFTADGAEVPLLLRQVPGGLLAGGELLLGVVLGLLVGALLRITPKGVDAWGVLLGGSLVGVGVVHGAKLSWLSALFAMGFTLSFHREQREHVRAKFDSVEHAVLLPTLALAGAHIDVPRIPEIALVLPVALLARAVFTFVVSNVARAVSRVAARGGAWLGPSMMSSGALTLCVAFACVIHRPGIVGQIILIAAVVDTMVGELVGPVALRRALTRAGELTQREAPPARTPVSAGVDEVSS